MIFNSANKFVKNISWWISFFTVVFWVLAGIPLIIFLFAFLMNGRMHPFEAMMSFVVVVAYIGVAFLVHRLSMIGFEFMKAIITIAIDCQEELKKIKEEMASTAEQKPTSIGPGAISPNQVTPPNPSPYNF